MIDEVEMYILEKVGVNFEVILERFSNKTNVYLSFVNKFSKDKSYTSFLEYYKKGDYVNAANHIHNIKGISGNLGFKKLYDTSEQVLEKLRRNNTDGLNEMVITLQNEYEHVITLINGG